MFLAYSVIPCIETILHFAAFLWIFHKSIAYLLRTRTAYITQGVGKLANSIMMACGLFCLFLLIVPNILFVFLTTGILNWCFRELFFTTPRYHSLDVMVSLEPVILYVKLGLVFSHVHQFTFTYTEFHLSLHCPFSLTQSSLDSSQSAFILTILNNTVLSFSFQWTPAFQVNNEYVLQYRPLLTSTDDLSPLQELTIYSYLCFLSLNQSFIYATNGSAHAT